MAENIVELYYKRVMESENPANDLMRFYCEVLGKQPNSLDIPMFREMITLFGRFNTYIGIVDLAASYSGKNKFSSANVPAYLRKIIYNTIKRNLTAQTQSKDLSDYVNRSKQEIENAKRKRLDG